MLVSGCSFTDEEPRSLTFACLPSHSDLRSARVHRARCFRRPHQASARSGPSQVPHSSRPTTSRGQEAQVVSSTLTQRSHLPTTGAHPYSGWLRLINHPPLQPFTLVYFPSSPPHSPSPITVLSLTFLGFRVVASCYSIVGRADGHGRRAELCERERWQDERATTSASIAHSSIQTFPKCFPLSR